MTQKHEKHLRAMGLMPTLLIQKCFFNKALHLVAELGALHLIPGPKAVGWNADFAGNLGNKAAQSVHF